VFTARYVLPTQCIYVFCVDLRTKRDYFTIQQWSNDPESYAGGSTVTGRASLAGQVKGDDSDYERHQPA
jgi:hypothetical protein